MGRPPVRAPFAAQRQTASGDEGSRWLPRSGSPRSPQTRSRERRRRAGTRRPSLASARRNFEDDASRGRARYDFQVRAVCNRTFEERVIRARPFSIPGRDLDQRRHPGRTAAIAAVIVAELIPVAAAAATNSCAPFSRGERTDTPRGPEALCAGASIGIPELCARSFAFFEERQSVGVAPSSGAVFGPSVKVSRMTTDVHHEIDSRKSPPASCPEPKRQFGRRGRAPHSLRLPAYTSNP